MWLRTALLLFLFLLLFRFITGVLKYLSPPRNDAGEPEAGPGRDRPDAPEWKPADVIDVPFREMPRETKAGDEEKERLSTGGRRP